MKIGNTPDKPAHVSGSTTQVATDSAKAGAVAAGPDASTQVALSSAAATLLSGTSNAEFDSAKVDRISKAIADGTYSINADAIADKLITNAQELLGKPATPSQA
jgi:negative regulator of flagellin synthesis FlgM